MLGVQPSGNGKKGSGDAESADESRGCQQLSDTAVNRSDFLADLFPHFALGGGARFAQGVVEFGVGSGGGH